MMGGAINPIMWKLKHDAVYKDYTAGMSCFADCFSLASLDAKTS